MSARWIAMATLAALCNAAHSQAYLYVCNNTEGSTISGSAPPPECKDRDIRVLNADGSLNVVILAPLTPQQRRERDAADQKRADERNRERVEQGLESQRDSLVLRPVMETATIDDIERSRQRSLANQQVLIDRATQRIAWFERERNFLVPEPAFFPGGIPDDKRKNIALYKLCIEQQENAVAAVQLEMQHINARFDADIARHRKRQEIANRSKPAELLRPAPGLPLPAMSH